MMSTVLELFMFVGALIAVLVPVVLLHEFGHFISAKLFGITVEVFSVGFGPRIWGYTRGGTDYRVSWIPLGGYVKLKGESSDEHSSSPDPDDMSGRPRWQRFVVFAMGPILNVLTAVCIMACLFVRGFPEPAYLDGPPVIGEVDAESPAASAGIRAGDRIVALGGGPVQTWQEVVLAMMLNPNGRLELELLRGGDRVGASIGVAKPDEGPGLRGITPATGVLIDAVMPGTPAAAAGLRHGDRMISINNVAALTANSVIQATNKALGQSVRFVVEREGKTLEVVIVPQDEGGRGRIGVRLGIPTTNRAYPLHEAIYRGVSQSLEDSGLVLKSLRSLVRREIGIQAFSGPIELARFSRQAAEEGLSSFLRLMAVLSVNLGVINLLPIPPLDGGHLFTLAVEGALRRDLSVILKERILQAGFLLLVALMLTILYTDYMKIH